MSVSKEFKERIRRAVDTWKQNILTEYPPEGSLNDIDLANFTIIHQDRHVTGLTFPKGLLDAHLVVKETESCQFVILSYPTIWDAENETEMLDHNIEVAIFDNEGLWFSTTIPHYLFIECFHDKAVRIKTRNGNQYHIDRYYRESEQTPKLDYLEKWPQIVVRDDSKICWASENFGDYQMNIKNDKGEVVIYAKQIPLRKRLLRPISVGSRMKLDVSVRQDIPKEIILFLAAKSV